jgi:hypothetical protein
MSTTTTFDLAQLTRGIETRDADGQVALYAPDATVTVADRNDQPGSPLVLRGRDQIRPWIEDVTSRDMTHSVGHAVQDDHGAAYTVSCRYADGTNVLCATVLELAGGLITGQTVVQVWDED